MVRIQKVSWYFYENTAPIQMDGIRWKRMEFPRGFLKGLSDNYDCSDARVHFCAKFDVYKADYKHLTTSSTSGSCTSTKYCPALTFNLTVSFLVVTPCSREWGSRLYPLHLRQLQPNQTRLGCSATVIAYMCPCLAFFFKVSTNSLHFAV